MGTTQMDAMPTILSFGENVIFSTAISYWDDATHSPIYTVYFSILAAMVMCFASAAYVVVKTVFAGVATDHGFYHTYAAWSTFGSRMFLYEVIILGLW